MRLMIAMLAGLSLCYLGCPSEPREADTKQLEPEMVVGGWRVFPGCRMPNGMRVEARVKGGGSNSPTTAKALAELVSRHDLISLPGVQGYSVGLCCHIDPRDALCLMFILEHDSELRHFVASIDSMLADEDLGIELSVIRDSAAPLPIAPTL